MCVSVSAALEERDVKRRDGFSLCRYTDQCVSKCEDLRSVNRWESTRKMTFVDVLVKLVDKRIQLLPLLAWKLQRITSMNPLTQRTTDRYTLQQSYLRNITLPSDHFNWLNVTWCRYPDRWSQQVKKESEILLE